MNTERIPSIHVFLSNSGGTGKTFYASLLADTLQRRGFNVRCFDADPTCRSLSAYKALQAEEVPGDDEMHSFECELRRVFMNIPSKEIRVLDCGPAAFYPFLSFLGTRHLFKLKDWCLHMPVWESRLPSADYGIQLLRPVMPLPLVLWLTGFRDRETARKQVLAKLPIEAAEVAAWVDFPLHGKQHCEVFGDYKTLSGVITERTDPLRAHRGRMFLDRWTLEANALFTALAR